MLYLLLYLLKPCVKIEIKECLVERFHCVTFNIFVRLNFPGGEIDPRKEYDEGIINPWHLDKKQAIKFNLSQAYVTLWFSNKFSIFQMENLLKPF